jgi:acyl-CoA dehydrogenase
MDFSESEDHRLVRQAIRDVCRRFDDDYWAECDHAFPWAFYDAGRPRRTPRGSRG